MNNLFIRIASLLRLKRADIRIKNAIRHGDVILGFGPSSLNLMMIDACNSQCIMCGKDYKTNGSGDFLSFEDIKKIYSQLNMRQVVDVIYGGGGEPFLNKDLAHIAAYTHEHYPVIQHTVITNFLAWKPAVVKSLLDSRVHFLISVNAASKDTFRNISGVNLFEKVIANIKKLVSLRHEMKAPVGIAMSMVLMKQNIGELSDFITLADELGVDEVKTLYVRIYPESNRKKHNRDSRIVPEDSLFFHQEESDRMLQEAKQLSKEVGLSFCHEPLFCSAETVARNCIEPWKSLFINFNGDVYPCPASEILFKPKIDSRQYYSGNILYQPIAEFWNNAFWQGLRKTNIKKNREDIIPECLCCGNSINWWGSRAEKAHVLDWKVAEESELSI
jgi:MoaA/NifB/PqqE/SkfB family radical SAM enzyme